MVQGQTGGLQADWQEDADRLVLGAFYRSSCACCVAFINALLWLAALSINTDGDTRTLGGGGHKHGSTLLWQSGLAA